MWPVQAKMDLSDEQRATLAAALRRYQGAIGALAKERTAINAALGKAATPGKDGLSQAWAAPSTSRPDACILSAQAWPQAAYRRLPVNAEGTATLRICIGDTQNEGNACVRPQ